MGTLASRLRVWVDWAPRRGWPLLGVAAWFACDAAPPSEPLPTASPPLPEPTLDGRGDVWAFEGGGRIEEISFSPEPVAPGEQLQLGFEVAGLSGCSGRFGLGPPRWAARQDVWRGRGSAPPASERGEDPRVRWVEVALEDGRVEAQLRVPAPFHPTTAVVVGEVSCGTRRRPVVRGPRAEVMDGRGPVPGARAVLGVVAVRREPTAVVAVQAPRAPVIDGVLDDAVWARSGTPLVESLRGEPPSGQAAQLDTDIWLAWDEQALYVAGSLQDEDVWTDYTERDAPLYRQEAFELMLWSGVTQARAPYVELQIAPSGARFDARFEARRKGDETWNGDWTAGVQVDGTLNRRRSPDEGWRVEVAIPWRSLCQAIEIACRPQPGAELRLNLFRLDKPDRKRQVGLALSPTLEPDFHAPDNAAVVRLGGVTRGDPAGASTGGG